MVEQRREKGPAEACQCQYDWHPGPEVQTTADPGSIWGHAVLLDGTRCNLGKYDMTNCAES